MTEDDLAARLARELGPLALDARWSAEASAGQPQGQYSDAIADAKAAMEVAGDLAAADLSTDQLGELRYRALLVCLERLELHYSTLVDTSSGGAAGGAVTQKLSQVQAAIARVRARLDAKVAAAWQRSGERAGAQGLRMRGRARPDYTLGGGDDEEPA